VKLEAWAVGITVGWRELPGRKGLWQETSIIIIRRRRRRRRGSWFRFYLCRPTQAPLNISVSQPIDPDAILNGEAVPIGSRKNSMNLFIAKPHYFDKCIKIIIFMLCKYNDFWHCNNVGLAVIVVQMTQLKCTESAESSIIISGSLNYRSSL
jgi:hypothetical protein